MKNILIVGIETVVGANLAATWADRARVIGLSALPEIHVSGCETFHCDRSNGDTVRKWLNQTQASHVVYCGNAARSVWESPAKSLDNSAAGAWAAGTAEAGIHFTLISSDAIFTGPWMFHDENTEALCNSAEAKSIRTTEDHVREVCPKSLIVRTNAFGWSPVGTTGGGWIESVLTALENNRPIDLDPISHATPILASDLADYLEAALEDELTGVFHIAGAERVSPHQFARQLASAFELAAPHCRTVRELETRPTGFGRGETSLQSRRFRSEYDCTMPLISEGISRLLEQQQSGYRDRLAGEAVLASKAA